MLFTLKAPSQITSNIIFIIIMDPWLIYGLWVQYFKKVPKGSKSVQKVPKLFMLLTLKIPDQKTDNIILINNYGSLVDLWTLGAIFQKISKRF